MSFSSLVDRVRFDFEDMPHMELTLPQAVRLWGLGADDCRYVLDALVDAGVLRWTAQRTIVKSGNTRGVLLEPGPAHISVFATKQRHNSVG